MKRGSIARFAMIAVLIGMLGLVGCASKQPPAPAPDTGSEWTEAPQPTEPAPKPARVTKVELETIYFDFDRYDIRADARTVLRGNAAAVSDVSGRVTTNPRGATTAAPISPPVANRRPRAATRFVPHERVDLTPLLYG